MGDGSTIRSPHCQIRTIINKTKWSVLTGHFVLKDKSLKKQKHLADV